MDLLKILNAELKENFKIGDITLPVFYTFPFGIRFEIGKGSPYITSGVSDEYIKEALNRAESIYLTLGFGDTILMVVDLPQEQVGNNQKTLELIKQSITGVFQQSTYQRTENVDGDEICFDRNIFRISTHDFDYHNIFNQIVCADLGGSKEFSSSVFLFDLEKHILFFLYDDRGLDVAASGVETLRSVYKNCNQWILDYDRSKIDQLFNT